MTIKELLKTAAEKFGDKPYLRYKYKKEIKETSFEQMHKDAMAFARGAHKAGFDRKHTAIIGATSREWICAFLGIQTACGVAVPIDKELPAEDVCELLNRADVSAFIYDDDFEDVAQAARGTCPNIETYINMKKDFQTFIDDNKGEYDCKIDPDALCTLMYTSGTTGKSKGVMLSNRNLCDNVFCADMRESADTVSMTVLPIHHAFCLTCDILVALDVGNTVCINDSVMRIAKNLGVFKPHIMTAVPMIIESILFRLSAAAKAKPEVPKPMIAKAALGGNLRTIYSGGAYLNPALIDGFAEFGIGLVQGYGMTECSPRISCNYTYNFKKESVGQLVKGCEAKIVEGEILVKSSSVMAGYYKDPENTKDALTADGWLKTGDLGHIDEDGFVYITGRRKNLIITASGENVSAEELENLLHNYPVTGEVLVYDEKGVITAELFPNDEIAAAMGVKDTEASIREYVDKINSSLPMYKRINKLIFRDTEFEKTTSKKIKRKYSN